MREMLIKVKAKPRAKQEYVKKLQEDTYEVAVKEPPEKGKANQRIIELLSEYFGVPKGRITLLGGQTAKLKLFKISGEENEP